MDEDQFSYASDEADATDHEELVVPLVNRSNRKQNNGDHVHHDNTVNNLIDVGPSTMTQSEANFSNTPIDLNAEKLRQENINLRLMLDELVNQRVKQKLEEQGGSQKETVVLSRGRKSTGMKKEIS